jgi:alkylated DNA repair dioxygenase AlkB
MEPEPWTPPLLEIKARIEEEAGVEFNSVLLNLYRDGRDGVAWHSDDEPELGPSPLIGSVSLGATRRFQFRLKSRKELRRELNLEHGSFLLMSGSTQRTWQHQVPKTSRRVEPRVNLTFRNIG